MRWSGEKDDRKEKIMANLVALSAFSLLFFLWASAFSQDAKLIEAAIKEGGKVVAYGSLQAEILEPSKKVFEKKTGLTLEYWRASATKVLDRAVNEYRAGKPLFDVLFVPSNEARFLLQDGMMVKYLPPTAKDFAKEAIDPDIGVIHRRAVIGVAYNNSIIKFAEAPKSLEELVHPKYKGKITMPDPTQHSTTAQWLASLYKVLGKENSEKFIRDLAAIKPVLLESLAPTAERISTGETPIGITQLNSVFLYRQKGAPVDYVRLGKFLGDQNLLVLGSKAVHPNAGKAFIDFYHSDESMKIIANAGEFVTRGGIYPPLPGADKVQFIPMDELDEKGYAAKKSEYEKIFLQ
jgi:iron(III) transport system substrate-binding protein